MDIPLIVSYTGYMSLIKIPCTKYICPIIVPRTNMTVPCTGHMSFMTVPVLGICTHVGIPGSISEYRTKVPNTEIKFLWIFYRGTIHQILITIGDVPKTDTLITSVYGFLIQNQSILQVLQPFNIFLVDCDILIFDIIAVLPTDILTDTQKP